jgi:hypothetical protein
MPVVGLLNSAVADHAPQIVDPFVARGTRMSPTAEPTARNRDS